MSEVGNEDAGGVLARLMRGANLRRSVEVLKAPDESLAATVSALANTAGGWILIGPDPEDGWRSAVGFDAEAAVDNRFFLLILYIILQRCEHFYRYLNATK